MPAGEHRLTVNAAGAAPHSERLQVAEAGATPTDTATDTGTPTATDTPGEGDPPTADFGATPAGVGGEIALVAREDARKLEVDTDSTDADLTDLAVEDDFAGRLYDSLLDGPDAVYVHAGGAYTTEVRDSDDEIGAFRVNPDPAADGPVRVDRPDTGKGSLAGYLADLASETAVDVAAVADTDVSLDSATGGSTDSGGTTDTATPTTSGGTGGPGGGAGSGGAGAGTTGGPAAGLARALDAVATAAQRAAERARAGDRGGADRSLQAVTKRLETVGSRLQSARNDLPDPLARATGNRLSQARRRSKQARDADKL